MGIYVINPPIIALNAATPVTITDSSANWTGSTVFSITSLTGVAITETSLVSATQVVLTISTGLVLGFVTVSDSADSDSIQIQIGATGVYGSELTLDQRWGFDNVSQQSQLIGSNNWPDAVRISAALAYADAEIQTVFAYMGNYAYPLQPIGSDVPLVSTWEAEIAYEFLYLSRGLRDQNAQGKNAVMEVTKMTRATMLKYRANDWLQATKRWPSATSPCGISGRL